MNIGKLKETDALSVLREGTLGRLGCIAAGWPYVVPVNYFFDGKDIYIHTLPGKKIDALRANPRACLQVDEMHQGGRRDGRCRGMVKPGSPTLVSARFLCVKSHASTCPLT